MDKSQPMSLAVACMDYFGRNRGDTVQTISQFQEEMRTLSLAERAFFAAELAKVGYKIKP